jgi:tRNA threonylcarbamoyladenosine biosynthesis protein TsaB
MQRVNILAIETSSSILSVALKKGGGQACHATVKGFMKHAENLLPVIDRLLRRERLKIGDVDAFLIGRGPGSFTGLRIGFATLKGLLAIREKPWYGASSLDLIAAGISPLHTPGVCGSGKNYLTVCLDAKRGKLYARSYRYHKKRWVPEGPSRVILIKEAAREFPRGSRIAGDGLTKFDAEHFERTPEKDWHPRASVLIELFEAKNPLLKKLTRPKDLLPLYLRNSEPEERLAEKRNHG